MKEALYYIKTGQGQVHCTLCPHNCRLAPGKSGICKARVNNNGTLYTLADNNLCAIQTDPVEKKPLYHFYPGAKTLSIAFGGCNLSCLNCQNYHISTVSPVQVQKYAYNSMDIVQMAINKNCDIIAYTYTEPIVYYEYMLETAKLAHQHGLKNVMITAGYINTAPLLELIPYLDAVNIDLKSFNNDRYLQLSKIKLIPVLETIKTLANHGVWMEITRLLIPGYTDQLTDIEAMCHWLVAENMAAYPLHFSRFFPMYKLKDIIPTPLSLIEKACSIARQQGVLHVYSGNVSQSDYQHTVCSNCNTLLVRLEGYSYQFLNFNKGHCLQCNHLVAGVWE